MTYQVRSAVLWIFLLPWIIFCSQPSSASEREVCPSGCAYGSIQAAIEDSTDGDSIVVHGGTYLENITIDKDLAVESLPGPAGTFIVPANQGPCVSFVGAQTSSLTGFSVQGGTAGRNEPSGIYIDPDVVHATVSNCIVRDHEGAGIYNDSGVLTLRGSKVIDNRPGPGLFLVGGRNRIENSSISGNENSGIDLQPYSSLTVVNSFITGNYALRGGGISVGSRSSLHIMNSTIAGNRGGDQLKHWGGGILLYGANTVGIVNSILWGNYPYSIQRQDDADKIGLLYSDLQDFTFLYKKARGEGVIRAKPYFVDPLSAFSAPSSGGDYHLSQASPCIDTGTGALAVYPLPDDDIDGQLRPQGAGYDMGADEYYIGENIKPLADIAINSSSHLLTVSRQENQRVYGTIGLNPGSPAGQPADWWIVVVPPFPYPRFSVLYDNRNWKEGIVVSKQDVLEHVDPKLVFYRRSSTLPVGTYTLYFGIDLAQNGKLDKKMLSCDSAGFAVVP